MIVMVSPPAQLSPSAYLKDMKMTTEEKLDITTEMYPPKIIELLDIATTSHYKVSIEISPLNFGLN